MPANGRLLRMGGRSPGSPFGRFQGEIANSSEGGAKIKIDDPTFVRPMFQLKFSRADQGRRCKVSWRKGLVIGVEFF